MKITQIALAFSLLFAVIFLPAQAVWQPIEDDLLYNFLDELANDQLIELSTVAKPYSRVLVYQKLKEAEIHPDLLARQRDRIHILLKDFGFDGDSKTDSTFFAGLKGRLYQIIPPRVAASSKWGKVMIRPVYGIRIFNTGEESFYASYGGAEMLAYLGKGLAVYGSIRDNFHQDHVLAAPDYLTREMGGAYKTNVMGRAGGDFSESRGGITYSWDWGSVGFVKDHVQWGNHYAGANIFSGRTPSFPMITLDLKPFNWLKFKYYHGWLVSEVVDSVRSYQPPPGNNFRTVYRQKQIAANLFTISPWKWLDFSFGNSIVYSDVPTQPAYLIPFMFFKSVDHTLNHNIDNQNSQLFADLSFRGIKHLHLFSAAFIDELSLTRIFDSERRNFYSLKLGAGLSNWPIPNVGLQADYTITSPLTYTHRLPSLTFESSNFNLGHFMVDNAEALSLSAWIKPSARWKIIAQYEILKKGEQHRYFLNDPIPLDEKSFLENIIWESHQANLSIFFSPYSNFSAFIQVHWHDTTFDKIETTNQFRPLFENQTNLFGNLGLQYGFQ